MEWIKLIVGILAGIVSVIHMVLFSRTESTTNGIWAIINFITALHFLP